MNIDANAYLKTILNREAVDASMFSPLWNDLATIQQLLNEWANRYLLNVSILSIYMTRIKVCSKNRSLDGF